MKCAGCLKVTKELGSIRCTSSSCTKIFCPLCIDISLVPVDRKKIWKCPDCCAAHKKGGDNNLTPIRGTYDGQNITTRKKEPTAENSKDDIKRLTEELCKISMRLEEVTQSLNYSHHRMEELMAKIEANDTRMKYLEKRDLEFTNLKSAVSQIQSDINIQAQNILLNEIELIGIPESPAENLQHTFQLATKKLGVELDEKDVDWITRVGPRRSAVPPSLTELQNRMPRPIVVRLLRRSKRDEILKASKSRRNIKSNDLDAPGTPQNIYFNERLTKENRILFRDARNRAKKEGYAYCWCNRGAIYVRRREGNAAVQLRGQSDLDRLFANTKTTVGCNNIEQEEQLEEINKRQYSSNYMNAQYKCQLCYKGFIDTEAWRHHVSKHSPSAGAIECPVCKFRFENKRQFQKHASNHEKKYACNYCDHISATTTQAKQHQRWHRGVTYKCQHCDEVSTKWTSYLSHVRMKHPSEFICGACGSSFVSRLGLAMHKTMMHKDLDEKSESGPYCAECDVQFASLEAYKRHMVTSVKHAELTLTNNGCRVCGETFGSGHELRAHARRHHAKKRPKNYGKKPTNLTWPLKCEQCSQEVHSAREYWNHFRRTHPDKPYPIQKDHICDVCGKSFRGNAFLTYHKRTHSEERQFKCETCGKAFHNPGNLYMHEKIHSDLRPYSCSVCFKAFKGKGGLSRHFRCHTGERPYDCEICGKAFSQSNSLKVHVRTVHLKQPAPYVSRTRLERRLKAGTGKDKPHEPFAYT